MICQMNAGRYASVSRFVNLWVVLIQDKGCSRSVTFMADYDCNPIYSLILARSLDIKR